MIGAAGSGRSRLAAEAVRDLEHVRVAGTRATRTLSSGAFTHLLRGPAGYGEDARSRARAAKQDTQSQARAVEQALGRARVLVVDDAHLLDGSSAALVHHLALRGRVRLLVTVRTGEPVPAGVSRLWEDGLLPRLPLAPPSEEACAELLSRAVGGHVDALTVRRLYRASGGDLRLLHELAVAVHAGGDLNQVSGTWTWRGTPPMTARVVALVEDALGGLTPREREALELVASGGLPSGPRAASTALPVLDELRAKGLVTVDDGLSVRLAHPLHGPVLRATAGRAGTGGASGARRSPRPFAAALAAECEELAARVYGGRLTDVPRGVGERMAEDDTGWDEPAMPEFCAWRARVARLRGEVREAVVWSREGLRRSPDHRACLAELAHASAYLGDLATAWRALSRGPLASEEDPAAEHARTWVLAAQGDLDGALRRALGTAGIGPSDLYGAAGDGPGVPRDRAGEELFALHDLVRLGAPEPVAGRLGELAGRVRGDLAPLLARHASALAGRDGKALDEVARRLAALGLRLHAAEAAAHAALTHTDPHASRAARALASALARACQGARSAALVDLALPRLTARQRQIVNLAATGLTNRQIAERLTVSVRTVANHLCDAYARLGSNDRAALGRLLSVG
ncbi:helix-turn-helix transcriptional regulator [Streptosporangium fragile]|uniref:Helix-turn-helix transcriptional regulator n=1 Tax=Streptosporangium fragile TaxID=46186 RepID=A0ABN3W5R7_9ACTN